jgi:hypothetical protein
MHRWFTSRNRRRSRTRPDATYLDRVAGVLVSFGEFLMGGVIVGVLLAALSVLYALSGAEDSPFINEEHQSSASLDTVSKNLPPCTQLRTILMSYWPF